MKASLFSIVMLLLASCGDSQSDPSKESTEITSPNSLIIESKSVGPVTIGMSVSDITLPEGMSLDTLKMTYPDHTMVYNYMDGTGLAYLESPSKPGMRFYLNASIDELINVEMTDDAVELKMENFKAGVVVDRIIVNTRW